MDRSGETFRFGPYELRPKAQQLFKHGVRLRLRPKPFLLLQVLLESGGEIVVSAGAKIPIVPVEFSPPLDVINRDRLRVEEVPLGA